jgi:hypothetical protein
MLPPPMLWLAAAAAVSRLQCNAATFSPVPSEGGCAGMLLPISLLQAH